MKGIRGKLDISGMSPIINAEVISEVYILEGEPCVVVRDLNSHRVFYNVMLDAFAPEFLGKSYGFCDTMDCKGLL